MEKGNLKIGSIVKLIKNSISDDALLSDTGKFYESNKKTLSRLSTEKKIDLESIDKMYELIDDFINRYKVDLKYFPIFDIIESIRESYNNIVTSVSPITIKKENNYSILFINSILHLYGKVDQTEYIEKGKKCTLSFPSLNEDFSPIKQAFTYLIKTLNLANFKELSKLLEGEIKANSHDKEVIKSSIEIEADLQQWNLGKANPSWKSIKKFLQIKWGNINCDITDNEINYFRSYLIICYLMNNLKNELVTTLGKTYYYDQMVLLENLYNYLFRNIVSDKFNDRIKISLDDFKKSKNTETKQKALYTFLYEFEYLSKKDYKSYENYIIQLEKYFSLNRVKPTKYKILGNKVLEEIKLNSSKQFQFMYYFYSARSSLLSNNLVEASKLYYESFKLRSFAGQYSKELLEELFIVSMNNEKINKVQLRSVYKWGYSIALISKKYSEYENYLSFYKNNIYNNKFTTIIFFDRTEAIKSTKNTQLLSYSKESMTLVQKVTSKTVNKNVTIKGTPTPPIFLAIFSDDVESVQKFIEWNVDYSKTGEDNKSILLFALENYRQKLFLQSNNIIKAIKIIYLLLDREVIPEINTHTNLYNASPLAVAISSRDIDLVKKLVSKGSNINKPCYEDDFSACSYAIEIHYRASQKLFSKKNNFIIGDNNLNYDRINMNGDEMFYHEDNIKNYKRKLDYLKNSNNIVQQKNCINFGSFQNNYDTLKKLKDVALFLIEITSDLTEVFSNGFNLYLLSIEYGDFDIFEALYNKEKGLNHITDQKLTSMIIASYNENYRILDFLLKEDTYALINKKDIYGNTALHYAISNMKKSNYPYIANIISAFQHFKADFFIPNNSNLTAHEMIMKNIAFA